MHTTHGLRAGDTDRTHWQAHTTHRRAQEELRTLVDTQTQTRNAQRENHRHQDTLWDTEVPTQPSLDARSDRMASNKTALEQITKVFIGQYSVSSKIPDIDCFQLGDTRKEEQNMKQFYSEFLFLFPFRWQFFVRFWLFFQPVESAIVNDLKRNRLIERNQRDLLLNRSEFLNSKV